MAIILVVDDDPQVRAVLRRLAERAGHQVLTADSVSHARRTLAAQDVNLVICDSSLPGEDGIVLVREIAAQLPDTAVFMLTGVDDPDLAQQVLELGATAYVMKPFAPNEILINIANSLRLRELEQERRRHLRGVETTLIDRTQALQAALCELESAGSDDLDGSAHDLADRLTSALTLRSEETGAHIDRMSQYAVILAEAHGVAWPAETVRIAGMLHDVGKIGVPDAVLLKPGPLTPAEFELVKRHPEFGFRLLANSAAEPVRLGASIALTHHERWDGGGYPRGLAGERIPIEGRIAAVADVFDALTSNRVYRAAMPITDAVRMLEDGRGTHFDPNLVTHFIGALDEILAIRDRYADPPAEAPIDVVLVDDHAMFADSLARLLSREPGIRLLGTASTAAEGVALTRRHVPDVVLMDWELPDGDGLAATEQIRAALPQVKVLLLTGSPDDAVLEAALRAGCSGFLSKHESADKLVEAIRLVHADEPAFPTRVMMSLLSQEPRPPRATPSTLSIREIDVLELIAQGLTIEHVARRLTLSTHTIRNHVRNAMAKLDVHTRLEAVMLAAREGLIRTP